MYSGNIFLKTKANDTSQCPTTHNPLLTLYPILITGQFVFHSYIHV